LAKSHSPLALSVVSVTRPGDVVSTASEILQFDDRKFGFSHDPTWAAMPVALRGILKPERVRIQLGNLPTRVASAISTLCQIGKERPVITYDLRDHPNAGLKEVQGLRVGPEVIIRAKATCWYVESGIPVIPILQPRKADLGDFKLGVYAALARRAFCRGDWANAKLEIVDLSGDDGDWRTLAESTLMLPSENELNEFIATYVQAQAMAALARAARGAPDKKPIVLPLYEDPTERA
jgi:hypothetical protein